MKHPQTILAISIGAVTLLVAATLTAAPGNDRFPIPVETLEAQRTQIFTSADQNGDGLISVDEFDAHSDNRQKRRGGEGSPWQRGDHPPRNRTAPTAEQHAELAREMDALLFSALDTDGDGMLSDTEFSNRAMRDARHVIMQSKLFARLDTDADGYLTTEEFPPRRLAGLDTNGDGEISRDEASQRHNRPDAG